jgi:hypothetical protein
MSKERTGEWTPAADFVAGTFNCAVGHASKPMRLLFNMAGIDGNITVGFRQIERLCDRDTVYRYEALYIAFHFARERAGSPFGERRQWIEELNRLFPDNPQYLYDLALAWRDAGEGGRALAHLEPVLAKMAAQPEIWSALMRAKLFWVAGSSALAAGERARARELAAACRKQGARPVEDDLEALEEALGG